MRERTLVSAVICALATWALVISCSTHAQADQVAKDENVLLGVVAGESIIDTIETRYFLTHGPAFCPAPIFSIPLIGVNAPHPVGAVCMFSEGDTLARPFVYSNASAAGGALLANAVVNLGVRGLDAIPAVRRNHGVLWVLLGGVALEGYNVFIHNAASIHGQLQYEFATGK